MDLWYGKVQCSVGEVPVSPSANPTGDISSGYSTNVYDGNRLSLPIGYTKTKDGTALCMMFIDLLDGC